MTQPSPSASKSIDVAIKAGALLSEIQAAVRHGIPPTDFGSLQIAYAAELKTKKVAAWGCAEYHVSYDTHADTTNTPRLFCKTPSIFEQTQ